MLLNKNDMIKYIVSVDVNTKFVVSEMFADTKGKYRVVIKSSDYSSSIYNRINGAVHDIVDDIVNSVMKELEKK